jgi:hypothetical protein
MKLKKHWFTTGMTKQLVCMFFVFGKTLAIITLMNGINISVEL